MRQREVIFAESARKDIETIYERVSALASWETAGRYIARLEQFCRSLDMASERGTLRTDIRQGLRVIGYEKSISIAFEVDAGVVNILRLIPAGRDWAAELSDD